MAAASLPPARRGFPLAAVALIMLIAATAAAAFVFRAQIFKIRGDQGSTLHGGANSSSTSGSAGVDASVVPPMVIPPANDTNWTLNLDAAVFPDTPAAGRIHGHDFLGERACLQGGVLTVRWGGRGAADFAFTIDFGGAQATALSGKTINITPKTPIAAKVTLRWQETGQVVKDDFDTGYALRLEFGELAGDHLPGKIYFCAPDDSKSYLAGTFNAEIRTPRSVKLNE